MFEAFILWRFWDDQEPRDNGGHGSILLFIFGQLVLWPLSLVYIAKTYLNVPLRRALLGTAVIVVWMLWLLPMAFAITGIIATLAAAWKVFEELDMI